MTHRLGTFFMLVAIVAVVGVSSSAASGASPVSASAPSAAAQGESRSGLAAASQAAEDAADNPATTRAPIGARIADRMILVAGILFSALLALFLGARTLVRRWGGTAGLSDHLATAHPDPILDGDGEKQTAFDHREQELIDPVQFRIAS